MHTASSVGGGGGVASPALTASTGTLSTSCHLIYHGSDI